PQLKSLKNQTAATRTTNGRRDGKGCAHMIIVLKPGSSEADIEDVSRRVRELGFKTHLSRGEVRTIIAIVGDNRAKEQLLALQSLDSVETVVRILQPFKLASREAHPDNTQFKVHGVPVGGDQIVVMAGP